MTKQALLIVLLLPALFTAGCGCGEGPLLQVTVLDVADALQHPDPDSEFEADWSRTGIGDAILVSTPNNRHYLIDAGLWGRGREVILPALRERGIEKLEAIIVTHPHGDHYGGVEYLLKNIPVAELMTNGMSQATYSYRDMLRAALAADLTLHELKEGEVMAWDEGVTATVLSTADRSCDWQDYNNQSVVIKLVYGNTSFLLTGDAEWEREEYLLEKYGDQLAADVLKVGHHGSTTSSEVDFLRAVRPTWAAASVDDINAYGFPPVSTLEKYAALGIPFYYTGANGEMTFTSDGDEVTFQAARQNEEQMPLAAAASEETMEALRLSDRSWHFIQEGDYETALPLLEQAVALGPEFASIHSRLGYCYKKNRDFGRAREEFETCLGINDNESYAHLHLGHLCLLAGDAAGTRQHLNAYLAQQPDGQFADLAKQWLEEVR